MELPTDGIEFTVNELQELQKLNDVVDVLKICFIYGSDEAFHSLCSVVTLGKDVSSPSKRIKRDARIDLYGKIVQCSYPNVLNAAAKPISYYEFATGIQQFSERWSQHPFDELLSLAYLVDVDQTGEITCGGFSSFIDEVEASYRINPSYPREALDDMYDRYRETLYKLVMTAVPDITLRNKLGLLAMLSSQFQLQPLTALFELPSTLTRKVATVSSEIAVGFIIQLTGMVNRCIHEALAAEQQAPPKQYEQLQTDSNDSNNLNSIKHTSPSNTMMLTNNFVTDDATIFGDENDNVSVNSMLPSFIATANDCSNKNTEITIASLSETFTDSAGITNNKFTVEPIFPVIPANESILTGLYGLQKKIQYLLSLLMTEKDKTTHLDGCEVDRDHCRSTTPSHTKSLPPNIVTTTTLDNDVPLGDNSLTKIPVTSLLCYLNEMENEIHQMKLLLLPLPNTNAVSKENYNEGGDHKEAEGEDLKLNKANKVDNIITATISSQTANPINKIIQTEQTEHIDSSSIDADVLCPANTNQCSSKNYSVIADIIACSTTSNEEKTTIAATSSMATANTSTDVGKESTVSRVRLLDATIVDEVKCTSNCNNNTTTTTVAGTVTATTNDPTVDGYSLFRNSNNDNVRSSSGNTSVNNHNLKLKQRPNSNNTSHSTSNMIFVDPDSFRNHHHHHHPALSRASSNMIKNIEQNQFNNTIAITANIRRANLDIFRSPQTHQMHGNRNIFDTSIMSWAPTQGPGSLGYYDSMKPGSRSNNNKNSLLLSASSSSSSSKVGFNCYGKKERFQTTSDLLLARKLNPVFYNSND